MGKNIVLDIDATLVHTHGDDEEYLNLNLFTNPKMLKYRGRTYCMSLTDVTSPPGTGEEMKLYGIYRPYLKEFIDFCFEYFDNVIVWSAGKKKYVEKMCELIFTDRNKQPLLVYNYDDCVIYDDYIRKPLSKLYEDPRTKGMINENNTYVLDDRDDTFALNKGNGVMIPEYEATLNVKGLNKDDDNLLKFMAWLSMDENKSSKDVRKLNKKRIFKISEQEYLDLV
jgi:hypothetical protein